MNNLKTIYPKHYFWVIYAHYDEEIMTKHVRWRNHDKTCTLITMKKSWQIIYTHVWQSIYAHYDEIMTNYLHSCLKKHIRSLRWNHDKTFTMKFWQNIYVHVWQIIYAHVWQSINVHVWQIIYEEIMKIHEVRKEVRKAVSYTHLTLPTN